MLPLRLQLQNFLAYKNPDLIDLTGLHIVVLCGPNGAGKSSLLDAITWVLWRQSRAGSGGQDQGLIREGEKEMAVTLDFSQDGQIYRVRRALKLKGKRTEGSVELSAQDASGQWMSYIGDNDQETNERIRTILRLDYETFVNSAYLQQGKADSFAAKTATERKRLLGEILDLDQWGEYEKAAKNKLHTLTAERKLIADGLERWQQESGFAPAYQQALAAAQAEHTVRQQECETADEKRDQARQVQVLLAKARDQIKAMQDRVRDDEKIRIKADEETRKAEADAKSKQVLLDRAGDVASRITALDAAEAHITALDSVLEQVREYDTRLSAITFQINSEEQKLRARIGALDLQIKACEKQIGSPTKDTAERDRLRAQLDALEQLAVQRNVYDQTLRQAERTKHSASEELDRLTEEGQKMRAALDQVQSGDSGACPLCLRPFDTHEGDQLVAHYAHERERIAVRYRNRRDALQEAENTLAEIAIQLKAADDKLYARANLNKQLGNLETRLMTAHDSEQERVRLDAERRTVFTQIEQRRYAEPLRAEYEFVINVRDTLSYDPDAHRAVRQTILDLRPWREQAAQMETARAMLPLLLQKAEDQREQADQAAIRIAQAQRDIVDEQATASVFESQLNTLGDAERNYRAAQSAVNQAMQNVMQAKQKLQNLEDARARAEQDQAKDKVLAEQISIYEELRDAFSKNGIPAMIIEAAIPRLETETNAILARMTDGRLRIWLKTQTTNKKGDTEETLDIDISDELGTRSYDLYSGGEAFRINFALRIALSNFLAQRAGARLQALFIDEGFGSQDANGRERLAEAINAVRGDFQLILVVTHIEELIEMFPTRLEVTKSPDGSQVRIR